MIGELARTMTSPEDQLLYSRSARDLIALQTTYPELTERLSSRRALLKSIALGRDKLEEAIDREARWLMRENERRLERYMTAAEKWKAAWPRVAAAIEAKPLREAHAHVTAEAEKLLPTTVGDDE